MKKTKLNLSKRLALNKDQIAPLNHPQAGLIMGGATTDACNTRAASCTCQTVLCPPQSRIIACITSPVTLACVICR